MVRLGVSCCLLLAFVAVSLSAPFAVQKKHDHHDYNTQPRRLVCYWGSWAYYHDQEHNYQDAFRLEAGDMDGGASMCTHIIYTFAKIDEYNHTMVPFDPDLETTWQSWNHDYYKKFIALREKNPKLTLMIAVGGWFEGSEKFSDMARVPTVRKRFVDNALIFLREWGFDGLDVDWEYPANRLGKPEDKEDFISLLSELNQAFAEDEFLLTTALSPGKGTIDKAYDKASIARINELVDWANVMTYDYHGGFDDPPYLGHNAPLYRRPKEVDDIHIWFTVNYTIHYYLELGLKKDKMVMGLPFYGRGFSLKDPGQHNLDDLGSGMSPAGRLSGQDGILGFNELCELENKGGWHNSYDPYYCAPYAYNDKEWIGYDNEDSLTCKVSFLKAMGLSGGMVWSLEFDDFKGDKCKGGKNPLLTTVHRYLNGDKKDVSECPLNHIETEATTTPTTPTTTPTTPTTTPTTPTTTPTTPTTTPTTPTTTPTTPTTTPTTPTTPSPTTPTTKPTPPPTTEPTGSPVVTMTIPGGHTIRCYQEGKIAHPTDPYKYVVCEHVKTGPNSGWYIHIMGCAPGTKWNEDKLECITDD